MNPTGLYTARADDGSLALMDTRTGRGWWRFLDRTGAQLWNKLTTGTDPDTAVAELAAFWAQRGADPERVRADLQALLAALTDADLLRPTAAADGRPAPEVFCTAARPVRMRERAAGAAGFALALLILRCLPIRTTIAVARSAARLPGRTAHAGQARNLFEAVSAVGRRWPGRSACLEESLGTYLAAALLGRRLQWVLGARFAPNGAHAWVEAGGAAVGQDASDRVGPYTPALRIGTDTD
ncbi:lasso peptide biosynthesis B2 protein [Kitasatospora purpeofusca]|uniref:lasso peptide biosynthesis B2 protein n=1 Tax=Kitasatospora purpeofusca TaxID=67352 RepID=UPI00386AA783